MNKNQDDGLMKAIYELMKRLFSKIFNFGDPEHRLDPKAVGGDLMSVSKLMGDLSNSHVESGDFNSAYVSKSFQVALDVISSNLNNLSGNIDLEKLKVKISSEINIALDDLASSDFAQANMADYSNRDEAKILKSINDTREYALQKLSTSVWGKTTLVADILHEVAEIDKDLFAKSPLTPAQKNGFAPELDLASEQEISPIIKPVEQANDHSLSM